MQEEDVNKLICPIKTLSVILLHTDHETKFEKQLQVNAVSQLVNSGGVESSQWVIRR